MVTPTQRTLHVTQKPCESAQRTCKAYSKLHVLQQLVRICTKLTHPTPSTAEHQLPPQMHMNVNIPYHTLFHHVAWTYTARAHERENPAAPDPISTKHQKTLFRVLGRRYKLDCVSRGVNSSQWIRCWICFDIESTSNLLLRHCLPRLFPCCCFGVLLPGAAAAVPLFPCCGAFLSPGNDAVWAIWVICWHVFWSRTRPVSFFEAQSFCVGTCFVATFCLPPCIWTQEVKVLSSFCGNEGLWMKEAGGIVMHL